MSVISFFNDLGIIPNKGTGLEKDENLLQGQQFMEYGRYYNQNKSPLLIEGLGEKPPGSTYAIIPSGYMETTGPQPSCFNNLSPDDAKKQCDMLGDKCVGFSYSKDGTGSGCYKGNHNAGINSNPAYMGYIKVVTPSTLSPAPVSATATSVNTTGTASPIPLTTPTLTTPPTPITATVPNAPTSAPNAPTSAPNAPTSAPTSAPNAPTSAPNAPTSAPNAPASASAPPVAADSKSSDAASYQPVNTNDIKPNMATYSGGGSKELDLDATTKRQPINQTTKTILARRDDSVLETRTFKYHYIAWILVLIFIIWAILNVSMFSFSGIDMGSFGSESASSQSSSSSSSVFSMIIIIILIIISLLVISKMNSSSIQTNVKIYGK
jgi:hypothetical protein